MKSFASSANLFAFACGPPWAWIDGGPVLSKLDVENRLPRTDCKSSSRLRSATHHRDGLARHEELPQIDRYSIHTRKQHMIAATGIKDQELAVIAERSSVDNPPIARGCDLGARPGGDREPLLGATDPIRGPIILDSHAVDRQRQKPLGGGKGNRRRKPAGVLQCGQT